MDAVTVQTLAHTLLDLSHNLRYIGAGVAVGALGGVGIGIGVVFGCYILALGRQPSMEKKLMPVTWLGFALAEAMGLFALLMAFIFIFT
ncbi:MAG: F0F1 ATP synthase subunit C [Rhodospirillaceae bacterium]